MPAKIRPNKEYYAAYVEEAGQRATLDGYCLWLMKKVVAVNEQIALNKSLPKKQAKPISKWRVNEKVKKYRNRKSRRQPCPRSRSPEEQHD